MTPDDPHICREGSCWLCDGGLACCKVCGLAERELDEQPECPGTRKEKEESSPEGVEILAEIAAQRGFYGE